MTIVASIAVFVGRMGLFRKYLPVFLVLVAGLLFGAAEAMIAVPQPRYFIGSLAAAQMLPVIVTVAVLESVCTVLSDCIKRRCRV